MLIKAKGMGFAVLLAISNWIVAPAYEFHNRGIGKRAGKVAIVSARMDTQACMPVKLPTSRELTPRQYCLSWN